MNETLLTDAGDVRILHDVDTGAVTQIVLYGRQLLERTEDSGENELAINGLPFRVRSELAEVRRMAVEKTGTGLAEGAYGRIAGAMCGERFINQYTGFGLDITRNLGVFSHLKQITFSYHISRVKTRSTYPIHGPGSPAIEGRMYVDTFTAPRWKWKLWGDNTRMIHLSLQGSGPHEDWGHIGYNRGTVAEVKASLKNVWRRQYPGVMGLHGAVYYDAKSGNWLAMTCRRAKLGYTLELDGAGLGLSYNFTVHDEFKPDDSLLLPEIKLHYGRTESEMLQFIRDYVTYYMPEPPEWNGRTSWYAGSLWTGHPSWNEFWARHTGLLDAGVCNGLGPYMLMHDWSRAMGGTTPLGYNPDPNLGPVEDFERGALAMKARGVPMGIWMSHSGMAPGREIDPDWFIRGVDGRWTASWGHERTPALVECNTGHPGYIAYTKKWIRYYIELGFKVFFFDCAGRAVTTDFARRDFMRYPGETAPQAVRFYDEITAYARSLDPDAMVIGEGSSSDYPIVTALNCNPVQSTDGLGPRDFLLNLRTLPGKRFAVDQAGELVPASGVCVVSGAHCMDRGMEDWFAYVRGNKMFKAVTDFVKTHGIYQGEHLPGGYSVIDGHLCFPARYRGESLVLPEPHTGCRALTNIVSGEVFKRSRNGVFKVSESGLYEMG